MLSVDVQTFCGTWVDFRELLHPGGTLPMPRTEGSSRRGLAASSPIRRRITTQQSKDVMLKYNPHAHWAFQSLMIDFVAVRLTSFGLKWARQKQSELCSSSSLGKCFSFSTPAQYQDLVKFNLIFVFVVLFRELLCFSGNV